MLIIMLGVSIAVAACQPVLRVYPGAASVAGGERRAIARSQKVRAPCERWVDPFGGAIVPSSIQLAVTFLDLLARYMVRSVSSSGGLVSRTSSSV